MDEIIVIRAADTDGSIFKAIVNALKDKRTEAVHVADTVSSVLRVGELEIHHEYRWVMMAGREVELNHGEYAMLISFNFFATLDGRPFFIPSCKLLFFHRLITW